MSALPKVSIVTPSFNHGEFLEETIKSVIEQAGDFFIDYIIIDGGSTDDSLRIIQQYDSLLKSGKRQIQCRGIQYRWVSEKDNGQAEAINKGIRMAQGDVVAWLNSDDYYLQGAFASVIREFQNDSSIGFLYGNGYFIDRKGSNRQVYDAEPLFDLWKLINLYDFILQPSVFINSETLKQAGFLDEKLHYIMDWEFWIRLSRFGKVRYLNEKLSCARRYPETKTQSSGLNRWREIWWCSHRYSDMKCPPVVITQLFHKPLQPVIQNNRENSNKLFFHTYNILKGMYYSFIGGNKSGVYLDGYAKRVAFLSIPLRNDITNVLIKMRPFCAYQVRFFINSNYSGNFQFNAESNYLKITVTDQMKNDEFMHVKFISDKCKNVHSSTYVSVERKASFIIEDILLVDEQGDYIKSIGLPNLRDNN